MTPELIQLLVVIFSLIGAFWAFRAARRAWKDKLDNKLDRYVKEKEEQQTGRSIAMPEQVFVVTAGGRPLYEVVKSDNGLELTIRSVLSPDRAIKMPSSAVDALIGALQLFKTAPQPGPTTN
jgi:hypothetical protein